MDMGVVFSQAGQPRKMDSERRAGRQRQAEAGTGKVRPMDRVPSHNCLNAFEGPLSLASGPAQASLATVWQACKTHETWPKTAWQACKTSKTNPKTSRETCKTSKTSMKKKRT